VDENQDEGGDMLELGQVQEILGEFRGLPETVKELLSEGAYTDADAVRGRAQRMAEEYAIEVGARETDNSERTDLGDDEAASFVWTQADADKAVAEANAQYLH